MKAQDTFSSPSMAALLLFSRCCFPYTSTTGDTSISTLLCAFVVLLSSVFADACYPGTFSSLPDRAAGFAENPNIAAFVLVLLCSCLVDFQRRRLKSHVLMALTSLGVLTTLSRGGGILLAVLFSCTMRTGSSVWIVIGRYKYYGMQRLSSFWRRLCWRQACSSCGEPRCSRCHFNLDWGCSPALRNWFRQMKTESVC